MRDAFPTEGKQWLSDILSYSGMLVKLTLNRLLLIYISH